MKLIALLLCLPLAACGGSSEGGSGAVPSALNPFATGYSCREPALSGGPEQRACYVEAQKRCPEGESPGQVEFEEQPDGQFLIIGYACD